MDRPVRRSARAYLGADSERVDGTVGARFDRDARMSRDTPRGDTRGETKEIKLIVIRRSARELRGGGRPHRRRTAPSTAGSLSPSRH